MTTDVLSGFDTTTFTYDGKTREVFRKGTGPAVVVIAEAPGITPKVVEFAERGESLGCRVALPHLFGDPGRDAYGKGMARAMPYVIRSMVPACVSHDFHALATGKTSPVIEWLRALARSLHEECGGPGVGVVGMCFTGGFALAMMADAPVLAPVLSQPSLPFPIGVRRKRDLGLSDADLDKVKARWAAEGEGVLPGRQERLGPSDGDKPRVRALADDVQHRLPDAFDRVVRRVDVGQQGSGQRDEVGDVHDLGATERGVGLCRHRHGR